MARIFLISLLLTTSAIAQERSIEPTVTLTSSELQAIVAAELARAQAASAMQKVQAAFAPKAPTPKIDEKK